MAELGTIENILRPELILTGLPVQDKGPILQALAGAVCRGVPGLTVNELLYSIALRDKSAPAPLGKGLAFAHARTERVPELTVALGVCPQGLSHLDPPDGEPVSLVLLFVVPKRHSDLYLRAMSALLRELSRPDVRKSVLACAQAEEVVRVLGGQPAPDLEAVSSLFSAAGAGDAEPVADVLARTPPAYIAELFEDLGPDDRARFLERMEPKRAAAVVEDMHLVPSAAAFRRISPEAAAAVLRYVGITRTAEIVRQLKPEQGSAILKHLGIGREKGVKTVLKYPEETAGGIMTPEVMSVPEQASVAEALKAVAEFPDRRQTDLYVVSQEGKLAGKCVLHELLGAPADARVSALMHRNPFTVQPEQDREDIRRLVSREDMHSIPVIGPGGALMGVVTQDDILDVIEAEASEDILRMGGAEIVDPLHTPIATRMKMRLPWLFLTLGGELFIALVISKVFHQTLEKAVVLAAFIPAIMATGGNVGLQSTTMVIRSLGMGTLKPKHTAQLVLGEVKLGFLTGLACGVVAAIVAYMINWNYHEVAKVSASVFLAMVSATLATSLMGTLEPIVLHKFKFDPATACGPFVTMFNDMFGSVVYLLIAMFMNFAPPG